MDCVLTYIPPYLSPSLLPFKAKCFFVTRPYPSLSRLAANTNNNASVNPIPNRGSGKYSEESLKILESLRRWSIPVAVGASIGSLIPHKVAIFAVSFSFLAIFVIQKTLKDKGEYFITVDHVKIMKLRVSNGINNVRVLLNRAIGGVLCAIFSLNSIIEDFIGANLSVNRLKGRTVVSFQRFLASFRTTIHSLFEGKMEVKSQTVSQNSALVYIKNCVSEVEDLIQIEESNTDMVDPNRLKELRQTLDLLKESMRKISLAIQKESAIQATASAKKHEGMRMAKGKLTNEVDKNNNKKKKTKEESSDFGIISRRLNGEITKLDESLQDSAVSHSAENEKQNKVMHSIPHSDVDSSTHNAGLHNEDCSYDGNKSSLEPENLWAQPIFEHAFVMPIAGIRSNEINNEKRINSNIYPDYWLQDDVGNEDVAKSISIFDSKQIEKKNDREGQYNVFPQKPEDDSEIESKNNHVRKQDQVDERDSKGYKPRQKLNTVESNDSKPNDSSKEEKIIEEFNDDPVDLLKELAFVQEDLDMVSGFSMRRKSAEYQGLMNEGEFLFKSGRCGLSGKMEVGEAETMLYRAAERFASASSIEPSSIEAIGLWGNTLFVHGKLKFKLSKEIRLIIDTPHTISPYRMRKQILQSQDPKKWVALEETLQTISKECEELLIQAGRKYRRVLSINNRNIPALYNWGLALCLRAQLIASSQNAAESADKVYLAAIDKFEALMGISRWYAPDAMLKWGLTLRARSRLHPMVSPERINLLNQAKQLFEDALRLQPRNAQLCGAYATSIIELEELQRKEMESKRNARFN